MTRAEMVTLLARVQVQDNRQVDGLVVDDWLDTIGDLDLGDALAALKRFRRERPDDYLRPGHLLQMAGVVEESPWVDRTAEVLEQQMIRDLAELETTPEEYRSDPVVRARVDAALDARAIERGEQ